MPTTRQKLSPAAASGLSAGVVEPTGGAGISREFFTMIGHRDLARIEGEMPGHASVLVHLWIRLLTAAFRAKSLRFSLADASLARQMGVSRATILRAKTALVSLKLAKAINRREHGNLWKNEPTLWELRPSLSPLFTDEHPLSASEQGGCSTRRPSPGNTKKESLGAKAPQTSLSKETDPGSGNAGGLVEPPATASGSPVTDWRWLFANNDGVPAP